MNIRKKILFLLIISGSLLPHGREINIEKQESLVNSDCRFYLKDVRLTKWHNTDQGIIMDQQITDVTKLKKTTNVLKKINTIIDKSLDRQQKLMGMLRCAHYINDTAVFNQLVYYGLKNNLFSPTIFKESDNTVKSFYQIKNVYEAKPQQTSALMNELFPNLEMPKNYPLNHETFDPVINDIKEIKYQQDTEKFDIINKLSAFEVTHDSQGATHINSKPELLKQRNATTKELKDLFNSTSLPNKLTLILRLQQLNSLIEHNIKRVENNPPGGSDARTQVRVYTSLFICITLHIACILQRKKPKTFLNNALENLQEANHSPERWGLFFLETKNISHIWQNISGIWQMIPQSLYLTCFDMRIKTIGFFTLGARLGLVKLFPINNPLFPQTWLQFLGITFSTLSFLFCFQPLPLLYSLYAYYQLPYHKELNEMRAEQQNVLQLITEFKESIQREYTC